MRLYHGTVHEFDAPDPGMGREATDFGVGFYATDSERMADDWLKDLSVMVLPMSHTFMV